MSHLSVVAPGSSDPLKRVEEDVRHWLEQAVIGLNLCPFAKAVVVHERLRIRVSDARQPDVLLQALEDELRLLMSTPLEHIETTLLVAPWITPEFLDFNDLVGEAQDILEAMALEGDLQIADFHPRYQFAGEAEDDMSHFTNRAPYPTLHLLRESSIDQAVAAYPDAALIYERNIARLQALGPEGWRALGIQSRVSSQE